MPFSSRNYQDTEDLQRMLALAENLRREGQRVSVIAASLHEDMAEPQVQTTARLWFKGSQLYGFAYIDRDQNIVDVFAAAWFTPHIQSEMFAWLEQAARHRNQARAENLPLDAFARRDDPSRVEMLLRFGFVQEAESSLLFAYRLDQPLPTPLLPPGFSIRPMRGLDELDAYVALHRAAFGTDNMTRDFRTAIMQAPDYLAELDLVAVAPDGDLAAFCVCQIFSDDTSHAGGIKEGWTDPVGTHPRYRQAGLAQALILEGMRLLRLRGVDTVLLGTSSTNTAMQKVAGKIGFQIVSDTLMFSKPLDG